MDLTDDQKQLIVAIARYHWNVSQVVKTEALMEELGRSPDSVERDLKKLHRLELVEPLTLVDFATLKAAPDLLKLAIEIRNPPARDYPQEVAAWFRSKTWSVPVYVVLIWLPAVYGYVSIVRGVCVWMGWIGGGVSH